MRYSHEGIRLNLAKWKIWSPLHKTVEDAVCYDMGTQQTEGQGGNHVAPQRPVPMGVQSTTVPSAATDTICVAKGPC